VAKALDRASKVPGGWCGLYGDCGAAVGAGIAVSVITGATPLTGKPRTLAMRATGQALSDMLDEQPRCCKRASRTAVRSTVDFLRRAPANRPTHAGEARCTYCLKNKECARNDVPTSTRSPRNLTGTRWPVLSVSGISATKPKSRRQAGDRGSGGAYRHSARLQNS